jgi:hypothetical protein
MKDWDGQVWRGLARDRREIPRLRRPMPSQERRRKKKPVCSARNDSFEPGLKRALPELATIYEQLITESSLMVRIFKS